MRRVFFDLGGLSWYISGWLSASDMGRWGCSAGGIGLADWFGSICTLILGSLVDECQDSEYII